MSHQITTAFVQQYKANVELLIQQRQSRFEPLVRIESQSAQYEFFEQIGPVSAQPWGPRHGDTPLMETPHMRRRVGIFPWIWADLIDNPDRIRMLIEPTSPYATNAVMAFNRRKDDVILAAATGTAMTGHNGETPIELPAAHKMVLSTGLTIDGLLDTKTELWNDDVEDEEQLTIACTPNQIADLLRTTEIKNADYNTVRALAAGDVDTFMGYNFVRTTRLPTVPVDSTDLTKGYKVSAVVFLKSGVLMSKGEEITVKIDQRPDKKYSTQVFVSMDIGGVRMDEKKVRTITTVDKTKARPAP